MIEINLPIRLVSPNVKEHWAVKSRRNKWQQLLLKQALKSLAEDMQLPCMVTITRLAPRQLDTHDNLPMSAKWLVDEIAEFLIKPKKKSKGTADNDSRIEWRYAQEKSKKYSIRIVINSQIV